MHGVLRFCFMGSLDLLVRDIVGQASWRVGRADITRVVCLDLRPFGQAYEKASGCFLYDVGDKSVQLIGLPAFVKRMACCMIFCTLHA